MENNNNNVRISFIFEDFVTTLPDGTIDLTEVPDEELWKKNRKLLKKLYRKVLTDYHTIGLILDEEKENMTPEETESATRSFTYLMHFLGRLHLKFDYYRLTDEMFQ